MLPHIHQMRLRAYSLHHTQIRSLHTRRGLSPEVTAGYYEMGLVGAAVDMLGLMYLGRLVEPIWGASELIHFVVVVNLCVGACTFVTMYTLYVITRSQFYLFAKFSGFHGILAALMVALRQLLPEERVPLPPPLGSVFRVRNKHLPGIYCTVRVGNVWRQIFTFFVMFFYIIFTDIS